MYALLVSIIAAMGGYQVGQNCKIQMMGRTSVRSTIGTVFVSNLVQEAYMTKCILSLIIGCSSHYYKILQYLVSHTARSMRPDDKKQ